MTEDDVIALAREAGLMQESSCWISLSGQMKFAALVAAAEREACAVLYNHDDVLAPVGASAWGEAFQEGSIAGAEAYRDAIRARGDDTR